MKNKTVPKLSPESEQHISDALEKVAEAVNAGSDPNEAIVKVATDMRLPVGHIRLMAHAYNNGRCLSQLREHEQLEEKAAAFPLADAENILERMYPKTVKTAGAAYQESAVASEYDGSPVGWLKRRAQAVRVFEKKASAPVEQYPTDPEKPARKAISANKMLQKEAEDAKHTAIRKAYELTESLEKLTQYFKQGSCVALPLVKEYVETALGSTAGRLLEKLAQENPKFAKQTSYRALHIVDWDKEPYTLVKQALDAMSAFKQAKLAAETTEKEAAVKVANNLRPFCHLPGPRVITGSVWGNDAGSEKSGGALTDTAKTLGTVGFNNYLQKSFTPPPKEEQIVSKMQAIGTPEHEEKLRAINTQVLLHDLMINDPVISGYPHEQVLQAYNQFSDLAPMAASHRMVSQTLLRQYLSQGGAMGSFDIDQLMKIEKTLRERNNATDVSE